MSFTPPNIVFSASEILFLFLDNHYIELEYAFVEYISDDLRL